jgi:hypothetical protein
MRNEQYLWRKRNEQHLQRRRTTSGSGAEEKPVTVGLCQANRKAKPSEEGHTAPKRGMRCMFLDAPTFLLKARIWRLEPFVVCANIFWEVRTFFV